MLAPATVGLALLQRLRFEAADRIEERLLALVGVIEDALVQRRRASRFDRHAASASFCSAAASSRPSKCSSIAPVVMSGRWWTSRHQFDQQRDAGLVERREPQRRLPAPAPARVAAAAAVDRAAHQAALWTPAHVRCARAACSARACSAGCARADAGEFGQPLLHQVAERAIGNLRQHRLGSVRPGAPCRRACRGSRPWPARRRRIATAASPAAGARRNRRAPSLRTMRVGILAVGQEQEERLASVLHPRQHRLQRLPRGAAAGAVAVEAEDTRPARCGTAARRGRAWSRCRAWRRPASRRTANSATTSM